MCGEQNARPAKCRYVIGSPPRVRGTVICNGISCIIQRITPACAGNSWPAAASIRLYRDHPRVCGEQNANSLPMKQLDGSPPRVRGTDDI